MEVSIVITCYNLEKYIARAIRSCLNQNFPANEYETIVVDDASTDNSVKVIQDFGNKVKLIRHANNRGLPAARNTGIRKALGRYVINVDGDDFVLKDLIAVEYLHLNLNAHWGGVSCDYIIVNNDGIHLSRASGLQEPIACGVMFRKDNLIAIGLYDEQMLTNEEKELRLRFMEKYHIGHVELPLYRYRRHEKNMTNNLDRVKTYSKKLKQKHQAKRKKSAKKS